jgi:putative ABC transport system substrate-binding protein
VGRSERAADIVTEFVREKVDLIVSRGTVSVLAAKQATSVIPIVFAGGDPVGTGLVVSLAPPGGNVTGLSLQQTDLAGKRLELLREVVPALRRLAILANAGNPVTLRDMREVEAAAGAPGFTVAALEIWRVQDIAAGFEALSARADMFRPIRSQARTNRHALVFASDVYADGEFEHHGGLFPATSVGCGARLGLLELREPHL